MKYSDCSNCLNHGKCLVEASYKQALEGMLKSDTEAMNTLFNVVFECRQEKPKPLIFEEGKNELVWAEVI